MTKINYHSPLVHGTQGAGVDLISIPSEQLYSVPKKRKILLAKLVLISTHVGNQNRDTENICKMRLVKDSKNLSLN